MKNVFNLFLFILLFSSCQEPKLIIDVSKNNVSLNFKHYEQDLFNLKRTNIENELDVIARRNPHFFKGEYKNPSTIFQLNSYLNNNLNTILYKDWEKRIGNYNQFYIDLNAAFSHYNYYFPEDSLPTVYTYISGINYEEPIAITQKEIIIGIDLFYGKDYDYYSQFQIPKYISKTYRKEFIAPKVMRKFAKQKYAAFLTGENMLENMIALGKIEYFIEAMMPRSMDSTRFQFTKKQMIWCYSHEKSFWKYLTMNNFLFSKDYHTYKKFLQHGPFVSSLERDSPGRAGIFIGYRIVKEFMAKNQEVKLQDLMVNTDFTAIFKDSKYNP
jgi:hypothetical protein